MIRPRHAGAWGRIFGVGVRLDSSFPWTQVQGNAGEVYLALVGYRMTTSPGDEKAPLACGI